MADEELRDYLLELPSEVLEDPELAVAWARRAAVAER